MAVELGTIRTRVPARLDRLPWSRFHWRIVFALGTVWILDGLEVTIVGSVAARMIEPGSGIALDAADIGYGAAIYIVGACLGALFFGQLTDRFGRKRLMIITLAVYVLATVATAFAFAPWYFFLARFVTGLGIGGEYAAVNSAIDELIPARNRGQVDITINGSYWVGAALGALGAVLLLNTAFFAFDLGWRLAFAIGGLLGFGILLLRRVVPESPRWLFIHGRQDEAERIADEVEQEVREHTTQELSEPREGITVRQRERIPFREIARVARRLYPKRTILGLSLFVGQAFLYNAVTFDLGTLLSEFFDVASGTVPYFMVIFAVGNFMGPLLLGRLFDTVGRKQMITTTYLVSSALTLLIAVILVTGGFDRWSFIALIGVTFFFASAGASSAYLTVSEIFPMETRALAIAFFYAVGTGLGGIIGPLLFGALIETGESALVAIGFAVGAVVMALGGVAELIFGVRSEGVGMENIAKPLTVADAEGGPAAEGAEPAEEAGAELGPQRRAAVARRERAEEEDARAAEHLTVMHRVRAEAADDPEQQRRAEAEQVLAEVSRLRAENLRELAAGHEEQAAAQEAESDSARDAAIERAASARQRARAAEENAEALVAEHRADADYHATLAEAADERARANEQRALAEQARTEAGQAGGAEAELSSARADMHEAWADMHDAWAAAHDARAERDDTRVGEHEREADTHHERALAAEQRVSSARHRIEAERLRAERGAAEESEREEAEAARRRQEAAERDERIRHRLTRRTARERSGVRRYRPGPGRYLYSPAFVGTASRWAPSAEEDLDREIAGLERALREHGALSRRELADVVGARYWGPGRFRAALSEAAYEGRVRRLSRDRYEPVVVDSPS